MTRRPPPRRIELVRTRRLCTRALGAAIADGQVQLAGLLMASHVEAGRAPSLAAIAALTG